MQSRPSYLGPEFSTRFRDRSVVDAYHLRPPYPDEVFDILLGLIADEPRAVLDVGCGSGDIARRLVDRVERVDAVDFSQPMIEKGKQLPNGDHPSLNWIYGAVEEVSLFPPYALVTAGQSLHWMEWDIVLPRFRAMLTPRGYLAIVGSEAMPTPWDGDEIRIIKRFSTNPNYQPIDLIEELERRGLFEQYGEEETTPVVFIQSLEDYIESFHARSSFSRGHMTKEAADGFDEELKQVVSRYCVDGKVELQIVGTVAWGRPGLQGQVFW